MKMATASLFCPAYHRWVPLGHTHNTLRSSLLKSGTQKIDFSMLYHKAVVEHKSAQVEVRVQDQGPGISSEKLEHIFDRFYCEEDVIVPRFGLGLPIAKALVEGMGGIISMNSEIDEGSVMILLLPGEQRA